MQLCSPFVAVVQAVESREGNHIADAGLRDFSCSAFPFPTPSESGRHGNNGRSRREVGAGGVHSLESRDREVLVGSFQSSARRRHSAMGYVTPCAAARFPWLELRQGRLTRISRHGQGARTSSVGRKESLRGVAELSKRWSDAR